MTVQVHAAGARRARWRVSLLRSAVAWAAIAFLVWFLWPVPIGGKTSMVLVVGNSMEPTFSAGDLVLARAGQPEVGDVIVYEPPGFDGALVVHRVTGGDASGWEVRGDNNDFTDPFTPTGSEVVGVVRVHIPYLGAILHWLASPTLWLGMILAAVVMAVWPDSTRVQEIPAERAS
ncbi:signal peptidase I [Demequina sp.]|uniref:signal peptidase I n=1 Tax=Demequina sp. TaxID=2050685 RepID=UPI003A8BEDEC